MTKSPIDSKSAGQRNERLILSLLRKHGTLSQTQLCRLVGIGSSTASTIVARLREKGLVIEHRGQSQRRGPKPVNLTLNANAAYILGIEISPSYVIIGLFDFVGQLVQKDRFPLGQDHSVENVLKTLVGRVESLLAGRKLPASSVVGAGVTLSGSVSAEGLVHLSSPLGWKDVPLKTLLAERLSFPVSIYSNRVRLLAEMAVEPQLAARNVLYLNVANGVGSTVYMNGRLIFGATGRYGEIGHTVIDPAGPLCGCGHRGCLEAHISGPALLARIRRDRQNGVRTCLLANDDADQTPESLLADWPAAVAAQDAYAIILRDTVAEQLSRCAAAAINSYDPDVIILGGYVCLLFGDTFIKAIREEMTRSVYDHAVREIDIRTARAGEDALICGVCEAVMQDVLSMA